MPYRIDIPHAPSDSVDKLVELGALDVESTTEGLAAIVPDAVTPDRVATALGAQNVRVSAAIARDNGSVWLLSPRIVRIGSIVIAPPGIAGPSSALRWTDTAAFGTGHHPTTALCIEAIEKAVSLTRVESVLDVGTGSGILALAALTMGIPRAVGVDVDSDALRIAAEHAHLNGLSARLELKLGEPDALTGVWPLVVANILAAPLIEMAPVLVRRVARSGRLILSGIPHSVEDEVRRAYQQLGMRYLYSETRTGWTVLVFTPSW
jgi:ribosomal protein L11 methyltransferase